jgi:hypothetical protein
VSDGAVYVAVRVAELPCPHVTSRRMWCSVCGQAVWVDPKAFAPVRVREPTVRVLCDWCAMEVVA